MLRGSFELIGDKSISHRAIMFSSISKGKNKISNFLMGEDCLSTVNCFRKMGVDIEINNNALINTPGINNANEPQMDYSIYIPKVKEVVIPRPVADGKDRPQPKEKAVFDF